MAYGNENISIETSSLDGESATTAHKNSKDMVIIPFSIQERDVDILILEQLHTNPNFVSWLSAKLCIEDATLFSARHSVYRENGETDILLTLNTPSGRIGVMIEDKIGAVMQPQQCERYHLRGQALCTLGEVFRYITVLCAPSGYLSSVPKSERWDYRLTHEEIADWMESDLSPSASWRRSILRGSAMKLRRARQADSKGYREIDDALVSFKEDYYCFIKDNYHSFEAKRQVGSDREFYIGAKGFPKGMRFKHSFFRGQISLVFERSKIEAAKAWLADRLPEDAWIETFTSELHVRMATEIMDPDLTLAQQINILRQALDGIAKLANAARGVADSFMQ